MPWFQDALNQVAQRSSGIKDRVREQARTFQTKAQQLEDSVTDVFTAPKAPSSAQELAARLQHEAKRLSQAARSVEVLGRWVRQLEAPQQPRQPRYLLEEAGRSASSSTLGNGGLKSSTGTTRHHGHRQEAALTFRQVFLRGKTLEVVLDAVSRSRELSACLSDHGLPPPLPEETSATEGVLEAPLAFAQTFVALLRAVVRGSEDPWIGPLGTLLLASRLEGLSEDLCYTWLVKLIAGLRDDWEIAGLRDQQMEVLADEDAARVALEAAAEGITSKVSPGSLSSATQGVARQGAAARAAWRALQFRQKLTLDLCEVAARRQAVTGAGDREAEAAAIAEEARARASRLEAEAVVRLEDEQRIQREQMVRAKEIKEKLQALEADQQPEIREVEAKRQRLLREAAELGERVQQLQRRQSEDWRRRDLLVGELHRIEEAYAASEPLRESAARLQETKVAMCRTIAEIAGNLAGVYSRHREQDEAWLATAMRQSNASTWSLAVKLSKHEGARLRFLARTAAKCAEVVQDREESRELLAQAGVPAATLEADVVGEAQINGAITTATMELGRCCVNVEALCQLLTEQASAAGDGAASHGEVAAELVSELRGAAAECATRHGRLAALSLGGDMGRALPLTAIPGAAAQPLGLFGANFFGLGSGSGRVRAATTDFGGAADDPFLLAGISFPPRLPAAAPADDSCEAVVASEQVADAKCEEEEKLESAAERDDTSDPVPELAKQPPTPADEAVVIDPSEAASKSAAPVP